MVDSNLQRESLLPSERAFAYKMKLDAMKHQGERVDLTSSQVGTRLRADEILAQQAGSSRNQVQRFIRLTELIPELLDMVDEKKIALNPAYELSFLKKEEQVDLLENRIPAGCGFGRAKIMRQGLSRCWKEWCRDPRRTPEPPHRWELRCTRISST